MTDTSYHIFIYSTDHNWNQKKCDHHVLQGKPKKAGALSKYQNFRSMTYKNTARFQTVKHEQMHNPTQQLPDTVTDINNTPFENTVHYKV